MNFIESVKDDLANPHGPYRGGVSRSSNQLDNLITDVRADTARDFVYQSKWLRIR